MRRQAILLSGVLFGVACGVATPVGDHDQASTTWLVPEAGPTLGYGVGFEPYSTRTCQVYKDDLAALPLTNDPTQKFDSCTQETIYTPPQNPDLIIMQLTCTGPSGTINCYTSIKPKMIPPEVSNSGTYTDGDASVDITNMCKALWLRVGTICAQRDGKCPTGQSLCTKNTADGDNTAGGNWCADLTSDSGNCGACSNRCAVGADCKASKCVCPDSAATLCKAPGDDRGWCVDLNSDTSNCGACNNACPAKQWCTAGKCVDPNAPQPPAPGPAPAPVMSSSDDTAAPTAN